MPSLYLQGKQPLRLLEEELRVHEGLVGDVLPSDAAARAVRRVDQERPVERRILEVVPAPVHLEDLLLGIGQHREWEILLRVAVARPLDLFPGLRGDGDDRDVGLRALVVKRGELAELLDAVPAARAEIEEDQDGILRRALEAEIA